MSPRRPPIGAICRKATAGPRAPSAEVLSTYCQISYRNVITSSHQRDREQLTAQSRGVQECRWTGMRPRRRSALIAGRCLRRRLSLGWRSSSSVCATQGADSIPLSLLSGGIFLLLFERRAAVPLTMPGSLRQDHQINCFHVGVRLCHSSYAYYS